MKMITITVTDDEPATTYIGDMNVREAAQACLEAYEELASESPGMTVDRTSVADWQP